MPISPLPRTARSRLPRLPADLHLSDIQGLVQLNTQAALGVVDLAEKLQGRVLQAVRAASGPAEPSAGNAGSVSGSLDGQAISALVYRSARSVAKAAGGAVNAVLAGAAVRAGTQPSSRRREAVLAAVNGVLGDQLDAAANPLAIRMQFRQDGAALLLDKPALARQLPAAGPKLLVLVHGLCMNDLQWTTPPPASADGHGQQLAAALGYTPVYLHYNTGRPVKRNGMELSKVLDQLLAAWPQPVDELVLLAHGMGGLVVRSACQQAGPAGHRWPGQLKSLVFLGTPHQGAPLERVVGWVDGVLGSQATSRPFAGSSKVRSAGMADMATGPVPVSVPDSAQAGAGGSAPHAPGATSLPAGVACYAVAATTGQPPDGLLRGLQNFVSRTLVGDGLVPVDSALGLQEKAEHSLDFAPQNQWIAYGTNHLELLTRPAVGAQLVRWLGGAKAGVGAV